MNKFNLIDIEGSIEVKDMINPYSILNACINIETSSFDIKVNFKGAFTSIKVDQCMSELIGNMDDMFTNVKISTKADMKGLVVDDKDILLELCGWNYISLDHYKEERIKNNGFDFIGYLEESFSRVNLVYRDSSTLNSIFESVMSEEYDKKQDNYYSYKSFTDLILTVIDDYEFDFEKSANNAKIDFKGHRKRMAISYINDYLKSNILHMYKVEKDTDNHIVVRGLINNEYSNYFRIDNIYQREYAVDFDFSYLPDDIIITKDKEQVDYFDSLSPCDELDLYICINYPKTFNKVYYDK